MNSKRALYKPVTNTGESLRGKRKPLAQGRLVRDKVEHSQARSEVTQDHILRKQPGTSLSKHPVSQQEDPAMSPRRETPQISFHDSPRVVKPSQSLDVSDVESELNFSNNSVHSPRDVLVMKARTPSPHTHSSTEVVLEAHFTSSPARVVCHSPGRVHTDLRDTGCVEQAVSIAVDRPQRVDITTEGDLTSQPHDTVRKKEAVNIEVSTFTEEVDHHHERKDEGESLQGKPVVQNLSHQTKDLNKENISASHSDSSQTSTKAKKKKSSRTVESRYMSHFGPVTAKGPMKAVDRNVLGKSAGLLAPVSTAGRKVSQSGMSGRGKKALSRTEGGGRQVSERSRRGEGRLGGTPDTRHREARHSSHPRNPSTDRKSSTPTADSSAMPETADISAIGPPNHKLHASHSFASPSLEVSSSFNMRSPQSAKKKLGFVSSASQHKSGRKGHSSQLTTSVSTQSPSMSSRSLSHLSKSHVSQTELELTYARLIQWVYSYASLKFGVREREKHFLDQMQGIRQENENLRKRKLALELELAQLQQMNALDEALAVQESGLGLVCTSLSGFRQQYHALSQSLDTTRHQIPTVSVLLPDCHEDFQAELEQCLGESEKLLQELEQMSRRQLDGVTECAKSLHLITGDLQAEQTERNRCGELLVAAGMLCDREASLQTMQLLTTDSSTHT